MDPLTGLPAVELHDLSADSRPVDAEALETEQEDYPLLEGSSVSLQRRDHTGVVSAVLYLSKPLRLSFQKSLPIMVQLKSSRLRSFLDKIAVDAEPGLTKTQLML